MDKIKPRELSSFHLEFVGKTASDVLKQAADFVKSQEEIADAHDAVFFDDSKTEEEKRALAPCNNPDYYGVFVDAITINFENSDEDGSEIALYLLVS